MKPRRSTGWRLADSEVKAIAQARHGDPFAVLGPHAVEGGVAIRAFVPHAETLEARAPDGTLIATLEMRDAQGVFEGLAAGARTPIAYRLHAANAGGAWTFDDPFRFGPVLGPMDDYLLVEGTHRELYRRLGAHPMVHEGVEGVAFAVWAPNARRVSVVGDFNAWDGRCSTMRKRIDSGLWETFIPGLGEGGVYKYEIVGRDGKLTPLKADPFGFASEMRPSTASVVCRTDRFSWGDEAHLAAAPGADTPPSPKSAEHLQQASSRRTADRGGVLPPGRFFRGRRGPPGGAQAPPPAPLADLGLRGPPGVLAPARRRRLFVLRRDRRRP
ncbi:MAG: hypothetical protein P4L73_16790, partial [Caulobacteraceae bacterium]|nr:hypothetical protein [Caulobacteraceae bacterium]